MGFKKITEQDSLYDNLEHYTVEDLVKGIHNEDQKVALAVGKVLPEIISLIEKVEMQLVSGGRLFYIGAGTSGRLGILDASECPPTFGSDPETVIGLIAGGKSAIYKAVENAEDSTTLGWEDLKKYHINEKDVVIGIAASGTTPYVVHALEKCQQNDIPTGCICCNPGAPLTQVSDHPIAVVVGPEFVTGSSRMKAGTAQNDFKHDYYGNYDSSWTCAGEQDGRSSIEQCQIASTGNKNYPRKNRCYCTKSTAIARRVRWS